VFSGHRGQWGWYVACIALPVRRGEGGSICSVTRYALRVSSVLQKVEVRHHEYRGGVRRSPTCELLDRAR